MSSIVSALKENPRQAKLGAAGVIFALAAGIFVWNTWLRVDRSTEVPWPDQFHFECLACGHQWVATEAELSPLFHGGQPDVRPAVECPKCHEVAAHMMQLCPWCNQPYIQQYLRDGESRPYADDICPHCGKDTYLWHAGAK